LTGRLTKIILMVAVSSRLVWALQPVVVDPSIDIPGVR
jgi:hypothetical protein